MARYTELLSEWLEAGGELPPSFATIQGFEELFIGEYIDHEIGYETPGLFDIKMNHYAELYIPPYRDRIDQLKLAQQELLSPTKVHIKTGAIQRDEGIVTHKDWELPTVKKNEDGSETLASPSNQDTTESEPNLETYKDLTDTDTGLTPDEALRRVEKLEGEVKSLMRYLLAEFRPLFMEIF